MIPGMYQMLTWSVECLVTKQLKHQYDSTVRKGMDLGWVVWCVEVMSNRLVHVIIVDGRTLDALATTMLVSFVK